jgi:uncharacterized membrane protein
MDSEDDYRPLPPRRVKHGSKTDHVEVAATVSLDSELTPKTKAQSFNKMQKEMNSRLARRKALKEFTLNPQGYMQKSAEPKEKSPKQPREKRKGKKRSGGLIAANIILWLFLLMIAGIFFVVLYYF